MWHSTRGIVFHSLKYSDTSMIVRIYTEMFGNQSYLIRGVRKSGSRMKPGLFQPMNLLALEVTFRERATLHSIREVSVAETFRTIPFDIRKSAVAVFINELAYRTIREEEPNAALFRFLWQQCLDLDALEDGIPLFHIRFTYDLMHHLGIHPRMNYSAETPVFNLREGIFQATVPDHPDYLEGIRSRSFATGKPVAPFATTNLLELLITYYRMHLPGFYGVESLHVLQEVFAPA